MTTTPSNNIEKLSDVVSQQVQELETALLEVLVDTRLDEAEGDQLDVIGVIVGRDRGASTDARYRDLLAAQIRLNYSSGTIPDVLTIVSLIVGSTVDLELVEYFPAAFEVKAVGVAMATGQGTVIAGVVQSAKAGGVNGRFRYYETEPVFRLDGAGGSQLDGGYHLCTSE
jgi:hypothetical protein